LDDEQTTTPAQITKAFMADLLAFIARFGSLKVH
jgi:hypothetical protein